MAKQIPLTRGKFALVDDEDYERLINFKWNCTTFGYATRSIKNKSTNGKHVVIWMHREIMNTPKGMDTDHIDGDKLNNKKTNLRICTRSQNNMNQKPQRTKYSSKYKGVYFYKKYNKWGSQININKTKHFIGFYENEEEAAYAYNEKSKEMFGEYAIIHRSST